jgi:serine/threonine protein phosphatase PrpC
MNNISACGKTDIGQKRLTNEDSYAIELDCGLFIVSDGMGGHTEGDKASTMAIEIVRDFVKKALSDGEITWPLSIDDSLPTEINAISVGIRLANRHIFNQPKDMGTTIVVLLIRGNRAYICHVGDSRLYRIRNNMIEQLTEDHSLVADEIRRGTITKENAKHYPFRHIITRAIGISADIQCEYTVEDIINEDMFLLCSDGLSGVLEDSDILNITTEENNIGEYCEKLVKMANEKRSNDNITAILVKCK